MRYLISVALCASFLSGCTISVGVNFSNKLESPFKTHVPTQEIPDEGENK